MIFEGVTSSQPTVSSQVCGPVHSTHSSQVLSLQFVLHFLAIDCLVRHSIWIFVFVVKTQVYFNLSLVYVFTFMFQCKLLNRQYSTVSKYYCFSFNFP